MPGGRPSTYNELMLEVAENYLQNYEEYGDQFPSNVGLALVLGIRRETVYKWGKDPRKAEFGNILDRIQAKQEQVLLNKGISGEFNSNIAKLVLGKHGYKDRSESDHNVTIHEKTIDDLE